MATVLERKAKTQTTDVAPDEFDAFADALTQLCREYQVGLEGAVIYAATPEDLAFRYRCEDNGELVRVR
jgi:hypothetical protein